MTFIRRIPHAAAAALLALGSMGLAQAHGGQVGDIEITHPYATPSIPGATNGAAYIATLENTGKAPDKLISASTPAAARTEIHTMSLDNGVMRMREAGEIALVPGAPIKMRPGMGFHLMLMGLKQPLKEGDSFPLTLVFEHAGKTEVKVIVQVPKARAGETAEHLH